MDKILRQLYEGEIYPAEQYKPMLKEYTVLRQKQLEHYEEFIKKLDSPLDKEFKQIMDEQLDTLPLDFYQMFNDGFRLGAKMMIEVFEDKYKTDTEI